MMLGKSVEPRARVVLGGLLLVALSCAHNVPQDKATGSDGKAKGAKPLVFDDQMEAHASGIVTYPGGDRIDWKLVELPEGKRGAMEITLTWQPPRPGLQLAFDVFDQWNNDVGEKKGKKKKRGKIRTGTVENAKGKYLIRVYAVGRGDAGKYKLTVAFKENLVTGPWDPLTLSVQEPPRLAAVPDQEVECTEATFDPKIKACEKICPEMNPPPNWPACKGKCPNPPDINIPKCWETMPCPRPPDERVKDCAGKFPPCNKAAPDPTNPNCRKPADPVVGRIVGTEVKEGATVLTIGAGKDQGVADKSWRAQVISGPNVTDRPVPGGDVQLVRVDKGITVGRTRLRPDEFKQTPYVKLSPP
jgi:hypothetical protein